MVFQKALISSVTLSTMGPSFHTINGCGYSAGYTQPLKINEIEMRMYGYTLCLYNPRNVLNRYGKNIT